MHIPHEILDGFDDGFGTLVCYAYTQLSLDECKCTYACVSTNMSTLTYTHPHPKEEG